MTAIARAIAMAENDGARPALIGALRHEDEGVRNLVMSLLTEIGSEEAFRALIECLNSTTYDYKDVAFRNTVVITLSLATGENFGRDYKKWKAWLLAKQWTH